MRVPFLKKSGVHERMGDCSALICCPQMPFFNCQPHRLTLGPEILDKSLFTVAFLQAKWCFHLHLCNCCQLGQSELEQAVYGQGMFDNESVRSNKPRARAQPRHSGVQLFLPFSSSPLLLLVLHQWGPVQMVVIKPQVGTEGPSVKLGDKWGGEGWG